jgi:hypothetical protein
MQLAEKLDWKGLILYFNFYNYIEKKWLCFLPLT